MCEMACGAVRVTKLCFGCSAADLELVVDGKHFCASVGCCSNRVMAVTDAVAKALGLEKVSATINFWPDSSYNSWACLGWVKAGDVVIGDVEPVVSPRKWEALAEFLVTALRPLIPAGAAPTC